MASLIEWKVPQASQPRAEDYPYDLERALSSVVGLHSIVPSDAFTADTLGVERAGNGVLIDDGVVLTIGYLITEAETVWLHLNAFARRAHRRETGIRRLLGIRPRRGDLHVPGSPELGWHGADLVRGQTDRHRLAAARARARRQE